MKEEGCVSGYSLLGGGVLGIKNWGEGAGTMYNIYNILNSEIL